VVYLAQGVAGTNSNEPDGRNLKILRCFKLTTYKIMRNYLYLTQHGRLLAGVKKSERESFHTSLNEDNGPVTRSRRFEPSRLQKNLK
jgi:hypothetical protein